MTAGLIILAVAIIIVAGVALHAMQGVRENQRAIARLTFREDSRWQTQARIDRSTKRLHEATANRLDALDARTAPSDGK